MYPRQLLEAKEVDHAQRIVLDNGFWWEVFVRASRPADAGSPICFRAYFRDGNTWLAGIKLCVAPSSEKVTLEFTKDELVKGEPEFSREFDRDSYAPAIQAAFENIVEFEFEIMQQQRRIAAPVLIRDWIE